MVLGLFLFGLLLFLVAVYVYIAMAVMTIAKRTKTKKAWLAWIPIANLYLLTQIAGVSGWLTIIFLLGFIPFIGILVTIFGAWIWWKIAITRHRPGWWGILMVVPIVNLVMIGILAWGKK